MNEQEEENDRSMDGSISAWMDGSVDRWMDERINGLLGREIDR